MVVYDPLIVKFDVLVSVNLFVVEFNEMLYVVVDGFNNLNNALINVVELEFPYGREYFV